MTTFRVLLGFILIGILLLTSPLIVRAISRSPKQMTRVNSASCVDNYNSVVLSANAAMIYGDRDQTVKMLERARQIAAQCAALQDGGPQGSLVLGLNR